MITVAAARSFIGELFPAVTVPFAWNAGLSLARTSSEVSARGSSSVANVNVCVAGFTVPGFGLEEAPLPLGTGVIFTSTGLVSSLKFTATIAAKGLVCDTADK